MMRGTFLTAITDSLVVKAILGSRPATAKKNEKAKLLYKKILESESKC